MVDQDGSAFMKANLSKKTQKSEKINGTTDRQVHQEKPFNSSKQLSKNENKCIKNPSTHINNPFLILESDEEEEEKVSQQHPELFRAQDQSETKRIAKDIVWRQEEKDNGLRKEPVVTSPLIRQRFSEQLILPTSSKTLSKPFGSALEMEILLKSKLKLVTTTLSDPYI